MNRLEMGKMQMKRSNKSIYFVYPSYSSFLLIMIIYQWSQVSQCIQFMIDVFDENFDDPEAEMPVEDS